MLPGMVSPYVYTKTMLALPAVFVISHVLWENHAIPPPIDAGGFGCLSKICVNLWPKRQTANVKGETGRATDDRRLTTVVLY